MTDLIVHIYEMLRRRRGWLALAFVVSTAVLVLLVAHQTYREDISDFLPLNNKYHRALQVYQDIAGANTVYAVFSLREPLPSDESRGHGGTGARGYENTPATDMPRTSSYSEPDTIQAAIERFVGLLARRDTAHMVRQLTAQVDEDALEESMTSLWQQMPCFLTDADYERMDSLLSREDYVAAQMADDKQQLLLPGAGMLAEQIRHDPLQLFSPVVQQLGQQASRVSYERYNGYIFSPDMKRGLVMMQSPYGASETEQNVRMMELLEQTAAEACPADGEVGVRFFGGPVIAVGNASQIKSDSMLSVLLAVVLIVILLLFVLRRVWSLLLIVLSIAWGWLFAMGVLAAFHDSMSLIVIGMSSVILGIAVNYPLHLIVHLHHTDSVKSALKEIVMPLVVGNVTTVGAFMALVPLESAALRDLGLFSALLLVGTILFVLLFLPHLLTFQMKETKGSSFLASLPHGRGGGGIPRFSFLLPRSSFLVPRFSFLLITLVLGWFSLDTSFDADISHINYMTEEQRADMAYFQQQMLNTEEQRQVFVVSSGATLDEALSVSLQLQPTYEQLITAGDVTSVKSCQRFLCPKQELARRKARWSAFTERYGARLVREIRESAQAEGFAPDTFHDFLQLLDMKYQMKEMQALQALQPLFASSVIRDSVRGVWNVIDVLETPRGRTKAIMEIEDMERKGAHCFAFDVESMNTSVATRLSDDFNYIGWACGLIVFLFLWFSLGSIELAMLSFLPMAVSWLWILGLMSLLNIQFNVVNVILATFIFGQGDDYTIFMTEGCQYEYAHRRKMLASYKRSIIISALIMFIGIGTLILAKHPALRSLAQVTIVGMFSVVLTAWLLPPLIFRWLVCGKNGGERRQPLTLRNLLPWGHKDDVYRLVADRYRYRGVEIARSVRRRLRYWRRHPDALPVPVEGRIVLNNEGWGETPLLLALRYPGCDIVAIEPDDERRRVARFAAEGLAEISYVIDLTLNSNDKL